MPVILIVFANDSRYLLNLLETESKAIQQILDTVPQKRYQVKMLPAATPQDLIACLNTCGTEIEIFHYSGHSNGNELALAEKHASAQHLAPLLQARCPNLKLVFLNGCETEGHVQHYQTAGIPHVIATNAKVRDDKSLWVATQLYHYLTLGRTLKEAFIALKEDNLLLRKGIKKMEHRGLILKPPCSSDELAWNLYQKEETVDFRLPLRAFQIKSAPEINHDYFITRLILGLENYTNPETTTYLNTIEEIKNGGRLNAQTILTDLLNVLPYPIGIRLRQINALAITEDNADEYYCQLLYDYACFLETLLQYVFGLLTSQIWEHQAKIDTKHSRKELDIIQTLIQSNALNRKLKDYLPAITSANRLIRASKIPHPCEKLEAVLDQLMHPDAYRFFDMHKAYFWQKIRLTEAESLKHCYQAQAYLNSIFPALGFVIEHVLISVRYINVVNARHVTEKYKGEYWRLFASETPIIRKKTTNRPMENKSVLSYKEADFDVDKPSINLFPFFIDRSAFCRHTEGVVDLYQFIGYFQDGWINEQAVEETDTPCFYFISLRNPGKIWRFDETQIEATLYHIDEQQDPNRHDNHMLAVAGELSNYFQQFKTFLTR